MKRSMCYLFMMWSKGSHEVMLKKKNSLQSKHAGLTSLGWPVVLIDHNFFLQLLSATYQGFLINQQTHRRYLLYYTKLTSIIPEDFFLALDSPRRCSPACCYGSLFMKHSSPALIRTEPQGHAEKKIWQNLLQSKPAGLTSFRWPVVLIDHNFLVQLLYATHQGFTISQRTHLHRLVSHCYNSLLTFSVMKSRVKWACLELQKVKMSQAFKSKKKNPLFSYINSGELGTTVTPRLH